MKPVVLKIALPDPIFFDHAAEVLRRYDGQGAIRLYELDPKHQASLYERCDPGTTAADHTLDDAEHAALTVLPQLWDVSRVTAVPLLGVTATEQVDRLRTRGDEFGEPLSHRGAELLTELAVATDDDHLLLATELGLSQARTIRWLAVQTIQLCSWLWHSGEDGPVADYERVARLLLDAS